MKTSQKHKHATVQSFKHKVRLWAEKLRVQPGQIRVQKMTRKWASCSTRKWVTFSEELLHEPIGFQDYVIVHELLHLKIPNHGKLFKSFLSAHLPGWKRFAQHSPTLCPTENAKGRML